MVLTVSKYNDKKMKLVCQTTATLLFFHFLGLLLVVAVNAGDDADPPPDFDLNSMMNQHCPAYRCSAGMTPVPKSRIKFESTGCSSIGAGSLMMTGGGGAEKPYGTCCDQWHACYQICGVAKKTCDATFESCAKKSCETLSVNESDDSSIVDTCKKDAELSVMMLKLGGCQGFNQAQYAACDCVATAKAAAQREAALRYFYKKQAPDSVDKVPNLATKADSASKLASLFIKLLTKYPGAIDKKEDPMKDMYERIQRETQEMNEKGEIIVEDREEETEESDEHVEL